MDYFRGNEKLTDNVDEWRGKNYFYYNNKCMTGPSGIRPVLMTSLGVLIPLGFFICFNFKVRLDKIKL